MATFGEKLGHLLSVRKLETQQVALRLRLRRPTVEKWLEGKGGPDLHQALIISEGFGVTLAYLADNEADVEAYYRPDEPGMSDEQATILGLLDDLGYQLTASRLFGLPDGTVLPDCPRKVTAWTSPMVR